MSKKHENPYTEGSNYNALFSAWRKKKFITRQELMEVAAKLKMGIKAAKGSVTVLLSPRHPDKVRKGADCRGNASARGHIYFADALSGGKLRLCWRPVELEPRARKSEKKVEATKTQVDEPVNIKEKEEAVEATA